MDITDGLQAYGEIRAAFGLFFLLIFMIICVVLFIYLQKKNYVSTTGSITLETKDKNGKYVPCYDQEAHDCNYYMNSGSVRTQIQNVDYNKPPVLGSVSLYCENGNASNCVQSSVKPSYIPMIICCILLLIFIGAGINLYLMHTNKTYGAVMGGINAATDVASVFSPSNNNTVSSSSLSSYVPRLSKLK
jgi:uncharacterized protein (UPF0333 family)